MVSFLITTLSLSIAGMVLLLVLKRIEMRRGRVIFARVRPLFVGVVRGGVSFVEYAVPSFIKRVAFRVWRAMRSRAGALIARVTLFFEHQLARILLFLHHQTQPQQGDREASPFLKEVAEHKRKLLRRAANKRVIVDEN